MPLLLSIRLWIGKMLFGTIGPSQRPSGVRVSPSRVIKGPCEETELEAIQYVATHTTIPVPRILGTDFYRGSLYLELEYVRGEDLSTAWQEGLSREQKRSIVHELASYIDQLRSLAPPLDGMVGSASFQQGYDRRVGSSGFGPFQDHNMLHSFLRGGVPLERCTEVFGEAVTCCHSRRYRSCFTHADLCMRNVIVREGKVAAIIDWEFAGWYPEYWEYTKAHYNMFNIPDWYEELTLAMPRYDEELAAERALWRLYDAPGDATCYPLQQ